MRQHELARLSKVRRFAVTRDEAQRIAEYRQAARTTVAPLRPPFLFLSGLQHCARLWVDQMNPPASGATETWGAVQSAFLQAAFHCLLIAVHWEGLCTVET
jgi:hypothetical protein